MRPRRQFCRPDRFATREPGEGRAPIPPPDRAAFTLVELMVVIVLIGILSAMVIPEMRGTYSDALLRSASRDIIAMCAIASSRAVSFNQPHRVRVDPASRRFRIERRLGRGAGVAEFVPVREVPGCEAEWDERITVRLRPGGTAARGDDPLSGVADAGLPAPGPGPEGARPGPALDVMFYPDGTADRVEFVLRDREGFSVTLRVNPITARVRVLPAAGGAR